MQANPPGLTSKAPYPSTVREIKFRRCLFTSSVKREIRHVHVVVVEKRAEKCTKKASGTSKVVVLLIKPIVLVNFSLLSASLDLKVPIVKNTTYPQLNICFRGQFASRIHFMWNRVTQDTIIARNLWKKRRSMNEVVGVSDVWHYLFLLPFFATPCLLKRKEYPKPFGEAGRGWGWVNWSHWPAKRLHGTIKKRR